MSEEQTTSQPETNGQSAAEVIDGAATTATAELEARLAQAEAQAAEYKDQWLRATADYKNFKRRAETERSELIRSAGAGLLLKLLPVVDDFDRAIANIPTEVAETPWWGGTQLIAQKLRTLLESESVKPIETVGQSFDPNLHEAVLYEDAEGQDGKVVAELQRGYKLYERVLRPAMVKVGRG
jgi:molecular chaperone GrpE